MQAPPQKKISGTVFEIPLKDAAERESENNDIMFSVEDDIFVSNARRAVEVIKQEKALESTKTGESRMPSLTSLTTFCWFIPLILIILQTQLTIGL